jgi:hypothetical protein
VSSNRITLEECGNDGGLRSLPPGTYEIEYHDATHLPPSRWVRLATVEIRGSSLELGHEEVEQFFSIRQNIGDLPDKPKATVTEGDAFADYARKISTVADTLSLALARVGVLGPEVDDDLLRQITELNSENGVVIVPDTNALHNGSLHWLLKVLHRPAVWLLPLVASITTVQTRDASIKSLLHKSKMSNLRAALRSRGLVNGALGLLERNKGRCQVVEIDPALLRYQKMASGSGSDPDQGDVLEDRLIIEGIHSVLRSMRSRTAQRVVTSDVNIARVLSAEGIDTLFVPGIRMGADSVGCLRYDPLVRGFVGAPLRAVLWELAHAFSAVRLTSSGSTVASLECYWPGKSPADWRSERLAVAFSDTPAVAQAERSEGAQAQAATASPAEPQPEPPNPSRPPAIEGTGSARPTARPQRRSSGGQRPSLPVGNANPGGTSLPRAALPQILRLLAAARRVKAGDAKQIVDASGSHPVTLDTARRAFDVLKRTGLLDQDGKVFRVTRDAEVIDNALRHDDLDAVSIIFERFEPYLAFREILRELGTIPKTMVFPLLRDRLGPIGTYESERLPRFHILLGQAWTDGDILRDGSQRPTDRDATDAFSKAFSTTATVGLAKVVDLLPRFCELTRMSPWTAKRRIERFVADRLLPDYSFQPSAGGKPVVCDEVVKGGLDVLSIEPIAIDRLHLGERPVFTVGGPSR